jgi:hypothetical protein
MRGISSLGLFSLALEHDPRHVVKVGLLLQECPDQDANEDGAKQAQRDNAEMLNSAEMSEDILNHNVIG